MGKPLTVVALLALAFGGAGSTALLTRAAAEPKALSAVQHEKRLGPKPTPEWYWRWTHWRLHARKGLRPNGAPHRIPRWAWRRFHYFLVARTSAHRYKEQRTRIVPTPSKSLSGSVYFRSLARNMSRLYSYETTPGDISSLQQGQSPSIWTCLCFNNNSMSLVADSRYGKAYKVAVGPGDRNPWNTSAPASNAAGQVSRRRDNDLGKWDWYSVAVRVDSWADLATAWADIISVGYQTSSGDQVRLGLTKKNGSLYFEVSQNSGYANDSTGYATGSVNYTRPILPVTFGRWREFVVGIKWATDNTGAVEVYSRTPGGSWSKVFEKLNEPTYLYGTTSYGTFARDGSNWPKVIDKLGLYYGYADKTKTTFPVETVYESGLTRSSDRATAQSTFP